MQVRHLNSNFNLIVKEIVSNFPKRQRQPSRQKAHDATSPRQHFTSNYCMNLVEKNEYENYLCTLLLSGQQRRKVFALRAFNVEVANSCGNVSEDHIGKLRLQFWYDAVDKCYEKEQSYVADNPVLKELKEVIDVHNLNRVYLKRLITARDRPQNQQFQTLKQMEEYAEQTYSSLLYLMIEMCGIKDMQVDHAASHLGKAQGIVTLLRAIPYTKRSQALNIPLETIIKHGISQERVMRGKANDKGVEDSIFEVASAAHQHLEKARSLTDKVPKELRNLFLPAVALQRYLERLRKANFRLTDQKCLQRDSMLPVALYWHNFRRVY